jgi:DNA modification methylase
MSIEDITPYSNNAKEHPKEQIEQIKKSIQDYGNNDPIAIDKDNVIIEGHGRFIALKELGYKEVEVIKLGHLTDEQQKAYRLIHNKLTMNSDFNLEMLESELATLQSFDMQEFGFDFLPDFMEEPADVDDFDIDEAIEEIEEPVTKQGDLWQLGNHRLYCGDSTKDISKLMNGKKADLLLTDPPYNVNVSNAEGKTIQNDNMSDLQFYEFLKDVMVTADMNLKEGGAFYIWHAETTGLTFRKACEFVGWEVKQCLIWVKNTITLGRQDYQWKHEPCLYGWKSGAGHYFVKNRKQQTVINNSVELDLMTAEELREFINELLEPSTIMFEDKPLKSADHPTMKPVRLMKKQVKNSTKQGEIVLDLFGGSGSTLLACEELDRVCYTNEIDPKYCDVIIKRYEQLTGQKAKLINLESEGAE